MMNNNIFKYRRKSYITIDEIFFWTATIHQWNQLLKEDHYKEIIAGSLDYLTGAGKVDVFAFVIMPNHIHVIWRIKEMNGKETAQGAFLKFTAHEFKKLLHKENPSALMAYKVAATNKNYEFWQRDSLAIHLYTKGVAFQKLDYIHNNPLVGRWQLVTDPSDYKYSSASFYEKGKSGFSFLKDLRDEF